MMCCNIGEMVSGLGGGSSFMSVITLSFGLSGRNKIRGHFENVMDLFKGMTQSLAGR